MGCGGASGIRLEDAAKFFRDLEALEADLLKQIQLERQKRR